MEAQVQLRRKSRLMAEKQGDVDSVSRDERRPHKGFLRCSMGWRVRIPLIRFLSGLPAERRPT
ncbi:hypothetical protein BDI01nite_03730 [Brevundimonas diminuta]|nr:hypothetical protein BDI01nite_03730 [Brevundimonas diminuta]